MKVMVQATPLDPWTEIGRYQDEGLDQAGKYGATAVFVGTMRDFNAGAGVQGMTLEHYPGMTEKYLEAISAEARERWNILDTLIIHRCGALQPNDPIVLLAVWSAHRAAAFEACRFLIEALKSRAPFWKKEVREQGEHWVTGNTPG